jgi:hypothetical protein
MPPELRLIAPPPFRLVHQPRSELTDRRARIRGSHAGCDCSLTVQFDPQDFAGNGHRCLRQDAAADENLRSAKGRLIRASRAGGNDYASIPIELGKSDACIAQPSQGIEGYETACVPGDNNMPQPSGGFCSRQKQWLRLLRAVANDEPIAIDANCRAGAADHDHTVPGSLVVCIIGVHRFASPGAANGRPTR